MLEILALTVATVAFFMAAAALLLANRRVKLPFSRLVELERQAADLGEQFEALLASHKRLRSRAGMRELRERRENGEDSGDNRPLNPADYKAQLRTRLGLVPGRPPPKLQRGDE